MPNEYSYLLVNVQQDFSIPKTEDGRHKLPISTVTGPLQPVYFAPLTIWYLDGGVGMLTGYSYNNNEDKHQNIDTTAYTACGAYPIPTKPNQTALNVAYSNEGSAVAYIYALDMKHGNKLIKPAGDPSKSFMTDFNCPVASATYAGKPLEETQIYWGPGFAPSKAESQAELGAWVMPLQDKPAEDVILKPRGVLLDKNGKNYMYLHHWELKSGIFHSPYPDDLNSTDPLIVHQNSFSIINAYYTPDQLDTGQGTSGPSHGGIYQADPKQWIQSVHGDWFRLDELKHGEVIPYTSTHSGQPGEAKSAIRLSPQQKQQIVTAAASPHSSSQLKVILDDLLKK